MAGPIDLKKEIPKTAFKVFVTLIILFIMVWINLNWRSANKITDFNRLLNQKKERLAYETLAEVISMHYSPFSPSVRKAFDTLVKAGNEFASQKDYKKAVWAYSLAVNSFPPLFYTPYETERRALKKRAAEYSQILKR